MSSTASTFESLVGTVMRTPISAVTQSSMQIKLATRVRKSTP